MLSFTWRQEEACDNNLGVSLKATGYPQAKHLAHGLQSFENQAKKTSMRTVAKTVSVCLEVTAKTTFIHVQGLGGGTQEMLQKAERVRMGGLGLDGVPAPSQ